MNEPIADELLDELAGLRGSMVKALRMGLDVAGMLTCGPRTFTPTLWEFLASDDELPEHPDVPPAELAELRRKARDLFAHIRRYIASMWPAQVESARDCLPPVLFDALNITPPSPADLL